MSHGSYTIEWRYDIQRYVILDPHGAQTEDKPCLECESLRPACDRWNAALRVIEAAGEVH